MRHVEYGTWAQVSKGRSSTVEEWVTAMLRQLAPGADFHQDGLCAEVRAATESNLPAGWSLHGNHFYGPYPRPDDALTTIRAAIDSIDLPGLSQQYDNAD